MTMVMFLKGVNHFANRLSYNAYDYDDAYSNTFLYNKHNNYKILMLMNHFVRHNDNDQIIIQNILKSYEVMVNSLFFALAMIILKFEHVDNKTFNIW